MKPKALIAPHGNEDSQKMDMKSDFFMYPPTGERILVMVSLLFKWALLKSDSLTAFLQTGNAERTVYVIVPKECKESHFL